MMGDNKTPATRELEDTADLSPVERIKRHKEIYRMDPDRGHDWNDYGGVPRTALLLTTTGRKTGKRRTLPLLYRKVGDAYVLVASKGGSDEQPGWYLNVMADPDPEIQVRRDHFKVSARTAEGAEREMLLKEMVAMHPEYVEYQTRTSRQLPVVVLEPKA